MNENISLYFLSRSSKEVFLLNFLSKLICLESEGLV